MRSFGKVLAGNDAQSAGRLPAARKLNGIKKKMKWYSDPKFLT